MISSIRCSPSACQLRLNRADGTPRTSIDLPDRFANASTWSPDQRWSAYIGGLPNADRYVTTVEVATGKVQRLATVRFTGALLVWLPDSQGSSLWRRSAPARRGMRLFKESLNGASRTLRVRAGPTPNLAFALDSKTALIYAAGELKRLTLDGDSVETPRQKAGALMSAYPAASIGGQTRSGKAALTDGDLDAHRGRVSGRLRPNDDRLPFSMLNGPTGLRMMPDSSQVVVMGLRGRKSGRSASTRWRSTRRRLKEAVSPSTLSSFTGELLSPDGHGDVRDERPHDACVPMMDLSSLGEPTGGSGLLPEFPKCALLPPFSRCALPCLSSPRRAGRVHRGRGHALIRRSSRRGVLRTRASRRRPHARVRVGEERCTPSQRDQDRRNDGRPRDEEDSLHRGGHRRVLVDRRNEDHLLGRPERLDSRHALGNDRPQRRPARSRRLLQLGAARRQGSHPDDRQQLLLPRRRQGGAADLKGQSVRTRSAPASVR